MSLYRTGEYVAVYVVGEGKADKNNERGRFMIGQIVHIGGTAIQVTVGDDLLDIPFTLADLYIRFLPSEPRSTVSLFPLGSVVTVRTGPASFVEHDPMYGLYTGPVLACDDKGIAIITDSGGSFMFFAWSSGIAVSMSSDERAKYDSNR